MNKVLKPLAITGLLLTIIPPVILFMGGSDSLTMTKNAMLAGMIIWFGSATPWLALSKIKASPSLKKHS